MSDSELGLLSQFDIFSAEFDDDEEEFLPQPTEEAAPPIPPAEQPEEPVQEAAPAAAPAQPAPEELPDYMDIDYTPVLSEIELQKREFRAYMDQEPRRPLRRTEDAPAKERPRRKPVQPLRQRKPEPPPIRQHPREAAPPQRQTQRPQSPKWSLPITKEPPRTDRAALTPPPKQSVGQHIMPETPSPRPQQRLELRQTHSSDIPPRFTEREKTPVRPSSPERKPPRQKHLETADRKIPSPRQSLSMEDREAPSPRQTMSMEDKPTRKKWSL